MNENGLNGLALVNINKKEVISENEIIEDFAIVYNCYYFVQL